MDGSSKGCSSAGCTVKGLGSSRGSATALVRSPEGSSASSSSPSPNIGLVVKDSIVFVVGSSGASVEDTGIEFVRTGSVLSVLGSSTASFVMSPKPSGCIASDSAIETATFVMRSSGTVNVGSISGFVKDSAGLANGCSAKASVI